MDRHGLRPLRAPAATLKGRCKQAMARTSWPWQDELSQEGPRLHGQGRAGRKVKWSLPAVHDDPIQESSGKRQKTQKEPGHTNVDTSLSSPSKEISKRVSMAMELKSLKADLAVHKAPKEDEAAKESKEAVQGKCRWDEKDQRFMFSFRLSDGKVVSFQTTCKAAGSKEAAERICRNCYEKFQSGASKEEVSAYREELYKKEASSNGVPVRPKCAEEQAVSTDGDFKAGTAAQTKTKELGKAVKRKDTGGLGAHRFWCFAASASGGSFEAIRACNPDTLPCKVVRLAFQGAERVLGAKSGWEGVRAVWATQWWAKTAIPAVQRVVTTGGPRLRLADVAQLLAKFQTHLRNEDSQGGNSQEVSGKLPGVSAVLDSVLQPQVHEQLGAKKKGAQPDRQDRKRKAGEEVAAVSKKAPVSKATPGKGKDKKATSTASKKASVGEAAKSKGKEPKGARASTRSTPKAKAVKKEVGGSKVSKDKGKQSKAAANEATTGVERKTSKPKDVAVKPKSERKVGKAVKVEIEAAAPKPIKKEAAAPASSWNAARRCACGVAFEGPGLCGVCTASLSKKLGLSYAVCDRVWCSGFGPRWPAKVELISFENMEDDEPYCVSFYGEKTSAWVSEAKLKSWESFKPTKPAQRWQRRFTAAMAAAEVDGPERPKASET